MVGDTRGYAQLEAAVVGGQKIENPGDVRDREGLRAALSRGEEESGHRLNGWVCRMCGFTHEGDDPPGVCPVCAVGRDQFLAA